MADDEKDAWVSRVLGITLGAAPAAAQTGVSAPLLPLWTAAKDRADAGIAQLQAALRAADDDDLEQIAEFGLFSVTQGQAVKLIAALLEADAAPSPATHGKLRTALDNYRDFLDGAPIVDLVEDNPFGVSVPLRATLGAALDEMERRLAA